MPRYQGYQQDEDDDHDQQTDQDDQQQDDQNTDNRQGQPQDDQDDDNRPGQPQDDQDADNRQGQQQDDDDGDNASQVNQNQQQCQEDGDGDNDNKNDANVRAGEVHSDDEDNHNAGQRGQPQDDNDGHNDDNDDEEDEQKGKASQQQDDHEDTGNTGRELKQADDDGNDEDRTKGQNDGDDDEQKASTSSNVNININVELSANLKVSELHKGGMIFSKKLLAQLFSGPGEDDPDEEEVPIHKIQHKHLETADSGEWTILELKTQDANGMNLYLKAKLDSGADDNFMSRDIYNETGLDLTRYDGLGGPTSITLGDGQQRQVTGEVRLEYTAGKDPQKFIEPFQVLEGLLYDVILGRPLMTRAHIMMVNPNFANPPNHPGLCVLALPWKTKEEKAAMLQRQKQKIADQEARYEQRIRAQDSASKAGQ